MQIRHYISFRQACAPSCGLPSGQYRPLFQCCFPHDDGSLSAFGHARLRDTVVTSPAQPVGKSKRTLV